MSAKDKQHQMIAESPAMKRILLDIQRIAKSNASVFICGESGTGKEVIAHAIHYRSERAQKPFIKVNCAAIPQTLIESEFFGHEKGSFTGAINRRLGRFECAHQGTLLLDEVSEIPLILQSKLLRVIQEQEFERVGGTIPIRVDVRLISTSNRNMRETVDEKLFREDLYYRLNVVPIFIPPLRERREDILPLARFFLERHCQESKLPQKELSEKVMQKLMAYDWPGNIRELANVIERALVMTGGNAIEEEHLTLEHAGTKAEAAVLASPSHLGLTLHELEKKHILETLTALKNNRTKAAQKLGISIRTLRNKLTEYQKGASQLPLF
jgi:two-component system response regulator AtoC